VKKHSNAQVEFLNEMPETSGRSEPLLLASMHNQHLGTKTMPGSCMSDEQLPSQKAIKKPFLLELVIWKQLLAFIGESVIGAVNYDSTSHRSKTDR
jgi:hypothetical protein